MNNRVEGGQRAEGAKSGGAAKRAGSTAGKGSTASKASSAEKEPTAENESSAEKGTTAKAASTASKASTGSKGSTGEVQLTKPEKRALAKKAAAKRAAAERRKKLGMYWTTGVVIVGVIAAIAVGCVKSNSTSTNASSSASATPKHTFGPLPEGVDAALGTEPDVKAGSGNLTELKTTTLVEGKGAALTKGQHIVVNYVGVSYTTGKQFDASWNNGQPFDFDLGAGGVIPGWDQGLVGVKIGSRVQLDIPSNLAYGDDASSGRPTGPLRFVIDVLSATAPSTAPSGSPAPSAS